MNNQAQTTQGKEVTTATEKPVSKFDSFRNALHQQKSSIERVLPAHIKFEKFHSVIMMACMQNPLLLSAHRPSMMKACVDCATDGLYPDGRDAAFVTFNSKVGKDDAGRDIWGAKVQYMPMYAGILKKVRQSEELAGINTQVVYTNDEFEHRLGDDDSIVHRVKNGNDRGEFYAVYCIAKLKDGTVMKDVMYFSDVEKVRKSSPAGAINERDLKYAQNKGKEIGDPKGIWADWYEEMAKKTVFRRLAKWLPQSVDKEGNEIRLFGDDEGLEIMDQHEEGVTWDEDGEATPEGNSQPDLKKIAQEKKATSNKVEKEKAEVKDQEKEPTETKAEEQEKQEQEDANQEKTPLELEREVRKVVDAATSYVDLYDYVTLENLDNITRIEKETPAAYQTLNAYIQKKLSELKEAK